MAKTVVDLPKARAMTRKEMREFQSAGLDPAFHVAGAPGEDGAGVQNVAELARVNAEMVDWILDNIYKDFDFDDVAYPECKKLAVKTYTLTYGTEEEAKNS